MQDLTLVGVHEDGEHLVLTGADGQRFRVRVDEPLRAAVRRDRARLGQLQIELDGRLRPKDIQARIRAGQTAEEIAEAAGIPVEHVRRYEGPVLAEREFVVRQARAVRIRRPGAAPGGAPSLGDLVAERLAAREVADTDTSWDAWRSEDGAWVVVLTFTAGTRQRQARWSYDASLRHVSAQDDEARWLTEDEPPAPSGQPARRLVPVRGHDPLRTTEGAVHDRIYDVEAGGTVTPAAGQPALPAPPAASVAHPAAGSTAAATVDLLDSLRERRGRRQRPLGPEDEELAAFESGSASWPADEPLPTDITGFDPYLAGEPPAAHPPRSRPDLAMDAEVLVLPDSEPAPAMAGRRRGRSDARADARTEARPESKGVGRAGASRLEAPPAEVPLADDTTAPPVTEPAPAPTPAPAQPAASTGRRGKRASVPSWDDIVFGSRRE